MFTRVLAQPLAGGGVFLLVTPARGKLWRLKYRLQGREKLLAIGTYPEIGLGEARRRRENARELIALGNGPSRERQREKQREKLWAHIQAADTFKAICDEYCDQSRRDGAKRWPPATAVRREYLLSLVCGSTGKRPIGEIEPTDVLSAIRRIEGKGASKQPLTLPGFSRAVWFESRNRQRKFAGGLATPTLGFNILEYLRNYPEI